MSTPTTKPRPRPTPDAAAVARAQRWLDRLLSRGQRAVKEK